MRSLAILFVGLSLMTGLPAAADFTTISRGHEVPFSNLRLPNVTTGTLSFRKCPDCDLYTLRVSPETRYVLNGEDLTLTAFRDALRDARGAAIESGDVVTVLHHLATDTVVSVTVFL